MSVVRRRLSLRRRLVWIIVATATAAVAVLVVGVQLLLANATTSETLRVLHARADAAASTVGRVDGEATLLELRPGVVDQGVWIFDARGHRIEGAVPPVGLRTAVLELSSTIRPTIRGVDGFRLYARPVSTRTGTLAVVVASLDLTPYESSERRGLVVSLALGAAIVLAAGGAAWASVHVSLGQVRRMVRLADDWREHDLTARFDLGDPMDELSELGQTLDRMLDRISTALHSERRLTDEVAHELRTPITVVRSEAQLALQSATMDSGKDEALRAIVAATERMDKAISTMLDAARSTARDDAEPCKVLDALSAVARHARAPDGVQVTIEDRADAALEAAAPQAVVVAALAPLVDNAIRHANAAVRLSAEANGQRVLLSVRDDGAGVEEEGRDRIFLPGQSSQADGAGLGLALSRRLAHSMGGEVHDRGEGHGLFVLDLPRE